MAPGMPPKLTIESSVSYDDMVWCALVCRMLRWAGRGGGAGVCMQRVAAVAFL